MHVFIPRKTRINGEDVTTYNFYSLLHRKSKIKNVKRRKLSKKRKACRNLQLFTYKPSCDNLADWTIPNKTPLDYSGPRISTWEKEFREPFSYASVTIITPGVAKFAQDLLTKIVGLESPKPKEER